jgi:polysaccharide export outer membrane protein
MKKYQIAFAFVALILGPALMAQDSTSQDNSSDASQTAASPAQGPIAVGRAHDDKFEIGNGDHLSISVWKEPDVSRTAPVRPDGKISLPLVGEIQAAGRTPLQLEQEITEKLRKYLSDPEVTVMVDAAHIEKYNVLGQVAKPGSYPLIDGTTVVDAIAGAGGFRDFAKQKSIYILRESAKGESRINFNFKDVVKGKHPEQNIKLEPRDTIVVP